jgi:Family of unknown function (DUF5662)
MKTKLLTLCLRYFPHFLQYVKYFKYLIRHKYVVFAAGCYVGVPYHRVLIHDLDKFGLKAFHYAALTFYDEQGNERYQPSDQYELVWLAHKKRNKHHWQAWVSIGDDGTIMPLPMDYPYTHELVADYLAFSATVPDSLTATEYYLARKESMILHPKTRSTIELLLMTYDDCDRQLTKKEGEQCHMA